MSRQRGNRSPGQLQAYTMTFPAPLAPDMTEAFLRTLTAPIPITFELLATDTGIRYRLRLSVAHSGHIGSRLRTLVPGTHVAPDNTIISANWTETAEVGLSDRGNARSKIAFRTTSDDARALAREYGRLVDELDFLNLKQFEIFARVATADGVSSPITGVTLPPSRPTRLAARIRAQSRQRYGRPLAEVQRDIEQRRTARSPGIPGSPGSAGSPASRRRPAIGGGSLP